MEKKVRKLPNSKIYVSQNDEDTSLLESELYQYALKLVSSLGDDLDSEVAEVTAKSAVFFALSNLKHRGYIGDSIELYVKSSLNQSNKVTFNEFAAVLHYVSGSKPKEVMGEFLSICKNNLTERQNKIIDIILQTPSYKDDKKKRYGPSRRGGPSYKSLGRKLGKSDATVLIEGRRIIQKITETYPAFLEVVNEWRRQRSEK